jgi:hypothetical protein
MLVDRGVLGVQMQGNTPWYYIRTADPATVGARFTELSALHGQTERRTFTDRMGDTAEIAGSSPVVPAINKRN